MQGRVDESYEYYFLFENKISKQNGIKYSLIYGLLHNELNVCIIT